MKKVDSMTELEAIRTAKEGWVYNDFTRAVATAGRDNVLHQASCPELEKMTSLSVRKLRFDPDEDPVRWLEDHQAPEDALWRRCAICNAMPVGVALEGSTPGGQSRAGTAKQAADVRLSGADPRGRRVSHERAAIDALRGELGELPDVVSFSGVGADNRLQSIGWEAPPSKRFQFGDLRFESSEAIVVVEFESAGGVTNLAKYWPMLAAGRPKRFVLAHVFRLHSADDYIAHRRLWRFLVERMREHLGSAGVTELADFIRSSLGYS